VRNLGNRNMGRLTTKPSEIFRQRVEPAYSEYLQNPLSEYHANNLAEALNNQVEWRYKYLAEVDPARLSGATLKSFRTDLLTNNRPLHVMRDLADAARHRELDRAQEPPRIVTLSTDAYYEEAGVLHVQGFHTPFPSEAGQAFKFWRNLSD
jgi:hypothetical protein